MAKDPQLLLTYVGVVFVLSSPLVFLILISQEIELGKPVALMGLFFGFGILLQTLTTLQSRKF